MNCPNDGSTLEISQRSGIEIDYCPQCRGVWLDRGELDKILERESQYAPPASPRAMRGDDRRDDGYRPGSDYGYGGHGDDHHGYGGHGDDHHGYGGRRDGGYGNRRRGGFLSDLFGN